jgi:hypothetical protein
VPVVPAGTTITLSRTSDADKSALVPTNDFDC